jgi:hypothetical protein
MGLGHICMFGFSVSYTNTFSEHLERRASSLDRHYREGYAEFMASLCAFHAAVDAGLLGNQAGAASELEKGMSLLDSCNEHLTAIGEALVQSRADLYEKETIDPRDPLVARDPHFAAIDTEFLYRELLAHGAALPQRLFWDDMAARVRDGGARAGLRLLDRHARELQSDLRTFAGEAEAIARLPLDELAPSLHGASRAVAAIMMGFTRLTTSLTYFSVLCERATQLYERDLQEELPAIAAAS